MKSVHAFCWMQKIHGLICHSTADILFRNVFFFATIIILTQINIVVLSEDNDDNDTSILSNTVVPTISNLQTPSPVCPVCNCSTSTEPDITKPHQHPREIQWPEAAWAIGCIVFLYALLIFLVYVNKLWRHKYDDNPSDPFKHGQETHPATYVTAKDTLRRKMLSLKMLKHRWKDKLKRKLRSKSQREARHSEHESSINVDERDHLLRHLSDAHDTTSSSDYDDQDENTLFIKQTP